MRSNQILLSLEHVTVAFGERILFHIPSLTVREGDRIGLVGMNGSGKTTLLRLMSGDIIPEEGTVHHHVIPRYFRQWENLSDHVCTATALERSLFGIQDVWEQTQMSGGENTRLRLADLFSQESVLLLLDEPSTNLDMDGIRYLSSRIQLLDTFVLVSHDRELLNQHCSRIWELEAGEIREYDGNYDAYQWQKEQNRQRAMTEYQQYTDEIHRLQQVYNAKKEKARKIDRKPKGMSNSEAKVREFSASHRSPASKAQMLERSANNVKQRMEHMDVKEKPKEIPKIRPDFTLTDPPRNPIILEAEHLSFAYPNGKTIFRDASFHLKRNSRTALLGANGTGKTTLLRLIEEGNLVRKVPKARIGFFHQDMSELKEHHTVLESVMEVSIQKESVARTMLARLLFPARDMQKSISVLSGGERIRLCFARLFLSAANVLILDEPTNFLDIPSVEALETLFKEYEGTLLFVSHDAAFVRAIATDRLLIQDQKIHVMS